MMRPMFQRGLPERESATRSRTHCRAFTVMELLLAATLLSLIIFALYSMFDQTQKALHSSIAQTDVNEGGRAAMELLVRELEQMSPSHYPGATNFYARDVFGTPVIQETVEGGIFVTNFVQDIFFLTRTNREISSTGYRVIDYTNGVGYLARFSLKTNTSYFTSTNLLFPFMDPRQTNFHRITDGIVHLRVVPYDRDGRVQTNAPPHILTLTNLSYPQPFRFSYAGERLPAYLDVELGVLEPAAVAQFRSIPVRQAAYDFLKRQAGKVYFFRQRIPIRTAAQ